MLPVDVKHVRNVHHWIKREVKHPSSVLLRNDQIVVTVKELKHSSNTVAEENCNPEQLQIFALLLQLKVQVFALVKKSGQSVEDENEQRSQNEEFASRNDPVG